MLKLVLSSKRKFSSYYTNKIVVKSTKKSREGKVLSNVGSLRIKNNLSGRLFLNDFELLGWAMVGVKSSKPVQKIFMDSSNRLFSQGTRIESRPKQYNLYYTTDPIKYLRTNVESIQGLIVLIGLLVFLYLLVISIELFFFKN